MRLFVLTLWPLLGFCDRDESLYAYGAADVTWRLTTIDGAAFTAEAHVSFPQPGEIRGRAPCNGFSGRQTAPYPWFSVEALAVTRRACPDLQAESQFLTALQAMTLAEVSGGTLILSTEDGRDMVFIRQSTDASDP